MRAVSQVALHTLRETVRDRVFAVTLLFAAVAICGSVGLGPLAAGERAKVIQDIGLATISGIGVLLAVFIGASLVHREVERRTVYTLLARPVGRTEYLLGKYAGILLMLGLNLAGMAAIFLALVHFHLHALSGGHAAAIYLIGVELAVIAAFSLLFSVVSSPVLGAFFTLALFFAGHLASGLFSFSRMLPRGAFRMAARSAALLLPNLELFNVKGMAVYGKPIEPGLLVWASAYGAAYVAAALLVAAALFRRKDLS